MEEPWQIRFTRCGSTSSSSRWFCLFSWLHSFIHWQSCSQPTENNISMRIWNRRFNFIWLFSLPFIVRSSGTSGKRYAMASKPTSSCRKSCSYRTAMIRARSLISHLLSLQREQMAMPRRIAKILDESWKRRSNGWKTSRKVSWRATHNKVNDRARLVAQEESKVRLKSSERRKNI